MVMCLRIKSRSRNMAVSCMRNASGHNYRNSPVIVDLAMRQIQHSTECISSYLIIWIKGGVVALSVGYRICDL